jgi:acetyl-CoA acyltransferase
MAAEAYAAGHYADELLDARDAPGFEPIVTENGIRADTSLERLASLKPAFQKPYGSVTAGNASFLTDGASAALIASEALARERSWPMMARILGFRFAAKPPSVDLLMGPALVIPPLLKDLGLRLTDIDVFEIHEAFAGQVLSLLAALDSESFFREHLRGWSPVGAIDMDRLNAWGGSLAIGHPFGATGLRLVSTAARRLHACDGRLALIASCAAGGQAHAMVIERTGGVR